MKLACKNTEWISDYQALKSDRNEEKFKNVKKSARTPPLSTKSSLKNIEDDLSSLSDKELKTPSRRSVRIETPSLRSPETLTPDLSARPKSRAISSANTSIKHQNNEWDHLSIEDLNFDSEKDTIDVKSLPNTPAKTKVSIGWKDDGITIPRPFQMTVRDEEEKIVDELLSSKQTKKERSEMFKAHPVPIESQIPLFDKIMADQEYKNHLVRERSKAALMAQMQPFSFTKRDEELQALTKRFSKSSPCIFYQPEEKKIKQFKAKPIPKSLFSNYIYEKMYEDDFYRTLQKKIRAEEMLKNASLPPSMAKREKNKTIYDVCPRSFRNLDVEELIGFEKKKRRPLPDYKKIQEDFEKQLEELKSEFISTSPRPFKFKKRKNKYAKASSSSGSSRTNSASALGAVSRSNLAAVLRMESAKKRLEDRMSEKLEEARIKEEARWREKLLRQKPVWQALAFSHEEDLAMRLRMRKEEERLRNEEHRLRMELMMGRVSQQPTLFERQSKIQFPQTKEEILEQMYREYNLKKNDGKMEKLVDEYLREVKDEAIQVLIDDKVENDEILTEKESNVEEKEKCESLSSS